MTSSTLGEERVVDSKAGTERLPDATVGPLCSEPLLVCCLSRCWQTPHYEQQRLLPLLQEEAGVFDIVIGLGHLKVHT